mmetsp:Transcript_10663/g.26926  ORF Transcript_10663/g.26926 Transcript_10663/m.26926 type:complete len:511 (-) Transcript_10663:418-1950(-)
MESLISVEIFLSGITIVENLFENLGVVIFSRTAAMAAPLHPDDISTELQCPICMSIPLEPRIVKCCSHVFCKGCIHEHLSRHANCPMCRRDCTSSQVLLLENESALLNRIWAGVVVKCEHHEKGCEWTGSISKYRAHEVSCPKMETIRRIQYLEGELTRFKTKNDLLKKDHQQETRCLKKENDTLKAANGQMEQDKQKHLREIRWFNNEKRKWETQYDTMKFEHDCMKAKIESMEGENEFMKNDNESIKVQLVSIRVEKESMRVEHELLKTRLESIQSEKKSVRVENEMIKAQHKSMKSEKESMRAEIESTKAENKSMKIENEAIKAQCQSMKVENESMKEKWSKFTVAKESMKCEHSNVKETEYKLIKAKHKSREDENNLLKAQQKLMREDIESMKAQQKLLKYENEILNDTYLRETSALGKANEILKGKNKRLFQDYCNLCNQHKKLKTSTHHTSNPGWQRWDFWCYSCGVNLHHNSDGCKRPKPGHAAHIYATRENPQGGNTKKDHL